MPETYCMRNYYGMGGAGPSRAIHSAPTPLVWRASEGPAAVPVGGGGA